jgi:hypothetical protein
VGRVDRGLLSLLFSHRGDVLDLVLRDNRLLHPALILLELPLVGLLELVLHLFK